jgi:class 3 adenylate cyclase
VRYRILGPLEVDPVIDHPALRRAKPRALLALLLLHANEVVSTDLLLDALWGGSPPPRAMGSLQNYVSHLRKALGDDVLATRPPGYVLRVQPEELDLAVFERLVAEARTADASARAERLRSALALWRGPALADFAYEQFAQAEIGRLDELRLTALEERIDADLELGRHGELVGELEALVTEHPLRERLRGQLMLALYRAGRQADALAAYRDGRRLLREELGLDPGEELRKLERAILKQDAALVGEPAPATAVLPAPTVRKVVTILFADVVGHTRLASSVDPESLRNVMRRFFSSMRTVIERHGGTPEKFAGDEVMAVFGVPVVHEDDALRAVRAADQMRTALEELSAELERDHAVRLELRIGVNTGEVVAGDPGEVPLVTGDAVNVGKRLQEAAQPGEIVLGPMTLALVRDAVETEALGPLELRNRPEPLQAFRVVELIADAPGVARRLDAPLVGRRKELRKLRAAHARARDKSTAVLALVVGDAGIGKTRLARELTAGVADEADVLVGRCVSYGEGATYLPLVDVVRQATRDQALEELLADDEDADAIARGLRALTTPDGGALPAGEASWAIGRFLRTLARRRPLVLVLDDLQWAEPTLLDLLEQVVERTEDVPLFVLATARGELLERRPQWADAHVSIPLGPLADDDAANLIANLAEDDIDASVRARIAEAAEGNPLFAEQVLAFVLEQGPSALDVLPPTIEALLASRLDTLDRSERAIVERASVVGRDFRQSEVGALSPPEEAGTVGSALNALVRRAFVRPRRATAATEDAFAFNHVLIRDVAYAAVPKERRGELHERFADWLTRRGDAPDEIVGYHLEQAFQCAHELRPGIRHARQLAFEAGECLARAGMVAFKRADLPAVTNLLERAAALLPQRTERRRTLLSEVGLAASLAGDNARAESALAEAIQISSQEGDRCAELRAAMELAHIHLHQQEAGVAPDALIDLVESAIPTFEGAGDHRSLGRAWILLGAAQGSYRCSNALWEEAAELAMTHYRAAGWPITRCADELASALFYGPRPVDEALARLTDLLHEDVGRGGEANLLFSIGALHGLAGRFDEGRTLVGQARLVVEELGFAGAVAEGDLQAAMIEALAGELDVAERLYRASCETLERRRHFGRLATAAAELADVLYDQGSFAEAERWARTAQAHTGTGDVSAEFSWRAALAKVRAQQDEHEEAETLVREAIRLVAATDALNQHGKVLLSLALLLRRAGRSQEAADAAREASALFMRKGSVVLKASADALQQELVAV